MLYTALLSVVLAAGTPADGCSEPSRVAWDVAALHEVVAEDASLSLADIQEAARQRGMSAPHPVLSFYVGGLAYDTVVHADKRISPDASTCGTLTTVTVRLALSHRLIDVARDLQQDPCAYEAALQHHRKHATADDALLSFYVTRLRRELADIWPKIEGMADQAGKADDRGILAAIEPMVERSLNYEQDRKKASAAVDSRKEAERLATACSHL